MLPLFSLLVKIYNSPASYLIAPHLDLLWGFLHGITYSQIPFPPHADPTPYDSPSFRLWLSDRLFGKPTNNYSVKQLLLLHSYHQHSAFDLYFTNLFAWKAATNPHELSLIEVRSGELSPELIDRPPLSVRALIDTVRVRPGFFLPDSTVCVFRAFLDGYAFAFRARGIQIADACLLGYFSTWLSDVLDPPVRESWDRLILFSAGDVSFSLKYFFDLFDQFISHPVQKP